MAKNCLNSTKREVMISKTILLNSLGNSVSLQIDVMSKLCLESYQIHRSIRVFYLYICMHEHLLRDRHLLPSQHIPSTYRTMPKTSYFWGASLLSYSHTRVKGKRPPSTLPKLCISPIDPNPFPLPQDPRPDDLTTGGRPDSQ